MRPVQPWTMAIAALAISSTLANLPTAAMDDDDRPATGPAVGITLDASRAARLPEQPAEAGARPFVVRVVARWNEVETSTGRYDWSGVEPTVSRIAAGGLEPVLCLTGSNPLYLESGEGPSPLVPGSVEAWGGWVRSAVRTFGGRVKVLEIWDGPDRDDPRHGVSRFDPEIYAFVLKSSSLAARAEARSAGVELRVAQGAVDPADLSWQSTVWEADGAAYVDILPLSVDPDAEPGEIARSISTVLKETLLHPPAPALWAIVRESRDRSSPRPLGAAAEALSASAEVALIPPRAADGEVDVAWAIGLHGLLAEGFAPAPWGDLSLELQDGSALPGAAIRGRFLSEEDFTTLVVCDLGEEAGRAGQPVRLLLDVRDAREARVLDPVAGTRARTPSDDVDGRKALRVPVRPYPVAILFRRPVAAPGFELPPEELEIASRRGLTAEEIIARYQAVQKEQDDRVDRLTARGRVDLHFRLGAAGPSVDVGIESNYFWERGGELEWEETDYFINGNRAPWKKFPQLPLIQPEKVITLPLDLTLDRTYAYTLVGEGTVNDRDAYILSFRPTDGDSDASLYRGRLWIDKETFVRLRTSLVQTNLEAPVLANEERDTYSPITGPDGRAYWILTDVDGQQLWTAGGRNFVVEREVTFTSVQINPDPAVFAARRSRAYESENKMLRETNRGFRYLERTDDGTRVVKEEVDSSQLFAAGGLFKDESVDDVIPLVGVNYFNYDLWDRDIQTNVLFAGVFAFLNITKPDLFERNFDAVGEAALSVLSRTDKVFQSGDEILEERIDFKSQNVSGRLGMPFGTFFKLTLVADVDFNSYYQNEDARDERNPQDLGFVLPQDHQVISGSLQFEFNRKGYTFTARGTWSSRTDWEPWGLVDDSTGAFVDSEYDPSHETFTRWQASVFKEWFLPRFQKISADAVYLDGTDLDRFSRYSFSTFGRTRLAGYSGSGVRFDRGAIARARYAFNVFDVIQFNASLETAETESELEGGASQRFTGVGLSGNFVGPWKTVFSFGYGRALSSDIPDLEGDQQFLLTVFKLF